MNYAKIVPSTSFIGEYMQMCSPLETAQEYDFWGAVWAMGTCIGREVYVNRPHAPVHLNWYVMFVSESGVTRKSTAVRMARDVVSDVLGIEKMVEGRSTPEHLFDRLTSQPHMGIAVSELATFLGRESYVVELPAFLTDLYDCPKQRTGGTVGRGEQVIEDAFLTFLTASTPSWLVGAVNPSVVEGGFTSRCMFIRAEHPKRRVAWPEMVTHVTPIHDQLQHVVSRAQEVGAIDMMPSGMKAFEAWYRKRNVTSDLPFLSSFISREDSHVLRLAACLCINDDSLAISGTHVTSALKVIAEAKAGALQIFSVKGTDIRIAQGIDKILRLMHESGGVGMGHTELYAQVRNHLSSTDFKILMQYMHELKMIHVGKAERVKGQRGPGATRYFATNELKSRDKYASLRHAML